jgi:hypothetical protein
MAASVFAPTAITFHFSFLFFHLDSMSAYKAT